MCDQPSAQLKGARCDDMPPGQGSFTPQGTAIDKRGVMKKIGGKISGAILSTTDFTKYYQELNLRLSTDKSVASVCVCVFVAWSEVNHCTIQICSKPFLPVMVIYTSIVAHTTLLNA